MSELEQAWANYQDNVTSDNLDAFLTAAALDPSSMTDAMRRVYNLATGGAQTLPAVTVTASPSWVPIWWAIGTTFALNYLVKGR